MSVDQVTRDDPAMPINVQWPVISRASELTNLMATRAREAEQEFLPESSPSTEAPPELNGTWALILAGGGLVGVRTELYDFAGATGELTSRTFYGEPGTDNAWESAQLIRAEGAAELNDLILQAVRDADPRAHRAGSCQPGAHGVRDTLARPDAEPDCRVAGPGRPEPVVRAGRRGRLCDREVRRPHLRRRARTPARHPGRRGREGHLLRARSGCTGQSRDGAPHEGRRPRGGGPHLVTPAAPGSRRPSNAERCSAALTRSRRPGGGRPTLLRPPYGSYNQATKDLGLPLILWDVDTLDWKNRSASITTSNAMRDVRPGVDHPDARHPRLVGGHRAGPDPSAQGRGLHARDGHPAAGHDDTGEGVHAQDVTLSRRAPAGSRA